MSQPSSGLPLEGVKVLDLSRILAGPLSTMILADLGADVIKVEHPERGDDTRDWGIPIGETETSYYYSVNRSKRSLGLDLGTEEGAAAIRTLVVEADVVVENFRMGGMEKFGLGYEDLRQINPKLIYCAIAGYDRNGPEAARPGYDLVIQGESGLMSINGEHGRPPLKFGVAAVDITTGMYAAHAILAALFQVAKTGKGRRIDLALYDCGVMLSVYYGLDALLMGEDPPRLGNAHPSVLPYGVFEAVDGSFVLACGNNRQFRSLCNDVLKRPDLGTDPRFVTNLERSKNRDVLIPALNDAFATMARGDLISALVASGIPCGEVLGLHTTMTSKRTRDAGLVHTHFHPVAGDMPYMAPPWRLDGERCPASPPPRLGEHTVDILSATGGWNKS